MTRKKEQPQPLLEIWPILRRFPWHFILPAFLVAVGVLALSLFLPRKYQGVGLFERRTDHVLVTIGSRGLSDGFQDPRQALYAELGGAPALDRLATQLLAPDSPLRAHLLARGFDHSGLTAYLAKGLRISSDIATPELDRVRVAFLAEDPVLVRAVVNGLVDNYIARTRATIDTRIRQSTAFFTSEVAQSRSQVEALETKKLRFEIAHPEALPKDGDGTYTSGPDASLQLNDLLTRQDELQTRLSSLKAALAGTPATQPAYTCIPNPEIAETRSHLHDLQAQLDHMVNVLGMTNKHPDVITLRERIAAVRTRLAALPAQVTSQTQISVNPKRGDVELMLATTQADYDHVTRQVALLRRQMAGGKKAAADLFPMRSEYLHLTRQVEDARQQLAFWEDSLRKVQVSAVAETGNRGVQLAFIQPCGVIGRPVSPNLIQVLAAAGLLGLLAGAIAVFLRWRTDDTFATSEQLARHNFGPVGQGGRAVGLPLLGSLGHLSTRRERRSQFIRRTVLYPLQIAAMLAVLLTLGALLYVNLREPRVFDQFRTNSLRMLSGQWSWNPSPRGPGAALRVASAAEVRAIPGGNALRAGQSKGAQD